MADLGEIIERQLQQGFRKLRFVPALEQAFREYHAQDAKVQRLLMLIIGAVLVAAMPFLDAWVLNPPAEYVVEARRVQFGLMLPAILLATAFTADPRLQRWSDAMGLAALFVVVCGWVYQRHLGAQLGYDVPAILIGVVLAGLFALAGLMFWAVAPVGVLGLIIFAAVEVGANEVARVDWYDILGLTMLALVTGLAGYLREYSERANWLRNNLLKHLSLQDPLTGLLNHRAFRQLYRQILNVARREQRAILVAALDVDHFKAYNDRYGHPRGDDCLVRLTQLLKQYSQRGVDLVGRVGGEEFALVWYHIDQASARRRLETLREDVEKKLAIPHDGHPGPKGSVVTVSAGAIWLPPESQADADVLFSSVDAALYEAKHQGRNRVVFGVPPAASATAAGEVADLRGTPSPAMGGGTAQEPADPG